MLVVRIPGLKGLQLLRGRNFRIYVIGFATSLLGAEMAGIALAFAVLGNGGSASDLSLVLASRILPLTLFLLGGGVIGDRYGRRYLLAIADSLRLLGQVGLAVYFITGAHQLWVVCALSALVGFSEALFEPAFEGFVPSLTTREQLHDANALLGLARSAATVAGPALAGVVVAVSSPVAGLFAGAVGYAVSVAAVLVLRLDARTERAERRSFLGELRQGWALFRSHTWLWTITLQFTMFNFVVWAPFLVLGPVAAKQQYAGAVTWGPMMAVYGVGAIVGGIIILGRRPARPFVVTTVVTIGWAAPSAALALRAPTAALVVAAFFAGIASATFNTLFSTAVQRRIPADSLSRIRSYVAFGAFSLGPLGLALAGPIATLTSIAGVLTVGVIWQLLANSALLVTPAIRNYRDDRSTTTRSPADVPEQVST